MNNSGYKHGFIGLILFIYIVIGTLFAVRTPDWQNPDEPAHYNYIRQVAQSGCCPLIAMGDWDSDYLESLKAARFAPELLDQLDTIQFEDHQPPLYYLLLSPVYQITNGNLTALRFASVLIGTLIIVCAYGVGITLYPTRPEIGLGAAAFVAFQPQHIAILASVNNDAMGWALIAAVLWACVVYVKSPESNIKPWMIGVLVGLIFITKATGYMMAGVAPLAILLVHRKQPGFLLRQIILFLIPAVALGALWWLRNFSVYNFPDFLGLAAHDSVVVGQLRTADYIAQLGAGDYLAEALRTTFYGFWGMFGWQGLPLVGNTVGWVYPAIAVFLVIAFVGLIVGTMPALSGGRADARPYENTGDNTRAWIILLATSFLAVLQYLYYNTEFVQFQGRYMFPLLIPLGVLLALGINAWRELLLKRWVWITPCAFFAFALLDLWLIWRIIPPNLAP